MPRIRIACEEISHIPDTGRIPRNSRRDSGGRPLPRFPLRHASSPLRGTGGGTSRAGGLDRHHPQIENRYERPSLSLHLRHPDRSGPHPPIARNSASTLRAASGGGSPSAMERIPRKRTSNARGLAPPCGKSSVAISSRWSACRTRSHSSTIPQKLRFTVAEERTAIRPGRSVHAMSRRTYRCSAPPNRFRLRHADFPTVTRTPASRVKNVRRRSASPRSMARARKRERSGRKADHWGRRSKLTIWRQDLGQICRMIEPNRGVAQLLEDLAIEDRARWPRRMQGQIAPASPRRSLDLPPVPERGTPAVERSRHTHALPNFRVIRLVAWMLILSPRTA